MGNPLWKRRFKVKRGGIGREKNCPDLEKSIKVQTPNPPKVVVYVAGFTKPASNICLYIAGG